MAAGQPDPLHLGNQRLIDRSDRILPEGRSQMLQKAERVPLDVCKGGSSLSDRGVSPAGLRVNSDCRARTADRSCLSTTRNRPHSQTVTEVTSRRLAVAGTGPADPIQGRTAARFGLRPGHVGNLSGHTRHLHERLPPGKDQAPLMEDATAFMVPGMRAWRGRLRAATDETGRCLTACRRGR